MLSVTEAYGMEYTEIEESIIWLPAVAYRNDLRFQQCVWNNQWSLCLLNPELWLVILEVLGEGLSVGKGSNKEVTLGPPFPFPPFPLP